MGRAGFAAWVVLASLGGTSTGYAQVGGSTVAPDRSGLEAELFGSPDQDPPGAPAADPTGRADLESERFGPSDGGPAVETATGAPERSDLESELFGGEGSRTPGSEVEARQGGRPVSRAGESPLLGRLTDALEDRSDRVAIGGQAFLRLEYRALDRGRWDRFDLVSPSTLDLYLDARPVDRVRGYVRARLAYDFTVSPDDGGEPVDGQGNLPIGGLDLGGLGTPEQTAVQLDQLWLKFDIDRRVFVTAGKQRVRWGTGRIWNPTDALNAQRFDPLSLFDVRLGVGLVKLHVPFEALGANLYGMALLDGAGSPEEVGAALRAEIAISPAEVAVSAVYRRGEPYRFGFDASGGLGDFELRAEVAGLYDVRTPFFDGTWSQSEPLELGGLQARYREDEVIVQAVLGVDYTLEYDDDDQAIIGFEYFFNDAGYDGAELYPILFLAPGLWQLEQTGLTSIGLRREPPVLFQPLYLGRHYLAALALFPAPFGLEDHSFTLTGIANLSDRSAVLRVDHALRLFRFLSLRSYVNVHTGAVGEFRYGLEVAPVDGVLDDGIELVPPLMEVGVALSATL